MTGPQCFCESQAFEKRRHLELLSGKIVLDNPLAAGLSNDTDPLANLVVALHGQAKCTVRQQFEAGEKLLNRREHLRCRHEQRTDGCVFGLALDQFRIRAAVSAIVSIGLLPVLEELVGQTEEAVSIGCREARGGGLWGGDRDGALANRQIVDLRLLSELREKRDILLSCRRAGRRLKPDIDTNTVVGQVTLEGFDDLGLSVVHALLQVKCEKRPLSGVSFPQG